MKKSLLKTVVVGILFCGVGARKGCVIYVPVERVIISEPGWSYMDGPRDERLVAYRDEDFRLEE